MTNPNVIIIRLLLAHIALNARGLCHEVSDELARSGIDTIQSPVMRDHVFKTTLPDDKRLPPLEEDKAEEAIVDAVSDDPSLGAVEQDEDNDELMTPSPGPEKSGLMKYVSSPRVQG